MSSHATSSNQKQTQAATFNELDSKKLNYVPYNKRRYASQADPPGENATLLPFTPKPIQRAVSVPSTPTRIATSVRPETRSSSISNSLDHNEHVTPPPLRRMNNDGKAIAKDVGREVRGNNDRMRFVRERNKIEAFSLNSAPSLVSNSDFTSHSNPNSSKQHLSQGSWGKNMLDSNAAKVSGGDDYGNLSEDLHQISQIHRVSGGFQPKGVIVNRTEEFVSQRARWRSAIDLDEQRTKRRFEKLLHVYSPEFNPFIYDEDTGPLNHLWRQSEHVWDLFQSKQDIKKHRLQQLRRPAEQKIVKWQDDSQVRNCCICATPFSLAVRRHHCRLCGRVVCSSPKLPLMLQPSSNEKESKSCSTLLVKDAWERLKELPARPTDKSSALEWEEFRTAELYAIRFCRDCQNTLHRILYHQNMNYYTPFLVHYELLQQLQRDINEALPDFHEMLFGLQKHDANATLASSVEDSQSLQSDALQARKDLLLRFTRYDQLAKKIKNLPPVVEGSESASQRCLQQAVYNRSTTFLQKNMHPLQNLTWREAKDPDDKAKSDQLAILAEQDTLLSKYLSAALASRNLDDVSALRANQAEIRNEISRLHSM